MDLYLRIDQNERFDFFEKYDTLSPLRKKIWQKIVSRVSQWPVCCPSQSKLAKWCQCSRSAISEAFKIFKEWGWLSLLSRGWKRSKTLIIPHSKRQLDVDKREYFKRVEATYRATHTYSKKKTFTSRSSEIDLKGSKRLEPSPLGQKLGFSSDGSLKLNLLSDEIQQETLRIAKDLGKNGWLPENGERYFLGIAFNIAKKREVKLDWPSYYRAK